MVSGSDTGPGRAPAVFSNPASKSYAAHDGPNAAVFPFHRENSMAGPNSPPPPPPPRKNLASPSQETINKQIEQHDTIEFIINKRMEQDAIDRKHLNSTGPGNGSLLPPSSSQVPTLPPFTTPQQRGMRMAEQRQHEQNIRAQQEQQQQQQQQGHGHDSLPGVSESNEDDGYTERGEPGLMQNQANIFLVIFST